MNQAHSGNEMKPQTENLKNHKQKLYSAVLSDTLDSLGYLNQVLSPGIRPLDDSSVLCGWARVGIYLPIYHDDELVKVYENELKLIDSLQPDEVPVLICHGLKHIAPWGELLSTRARYLQAAGCLTDGSVRDVRVIREMKFPVFTGGITPVDTKYRGKLAWYDVPGKIHGVDVESGDLVFGDVDGVVIIPKNLVETVLDQSLQKVSDENMVRKKIVSGESLEKIFADHGIL